MPEHPAHYRFFRPILWDNGEEWAGYRYSTGATANIVKYRDELFLLTVEHAMKDREKEYQLEDCRILWRMDHPAYCNIGYGATFHTDDHKGNKLLTDLRIHQLNGPSTPVPALEPGEYLDLDWAPPGQSTSPCALTGFPHFDQEVDYDDNSVKFKPYTMHGGSAPTSEKDIFKFISPHLKGMDAAGFSGGLITQLVDDKIKTLGICIQGGGNKDIDFIHFISSQALQPFFEGAYQNIQSRNHVLIEAPAVSHHQGSDAAFHEELLNSEVS